MQGINGKCLVSSCNSEETHNTLKFAHWSKHVEIKASQNKLEAGQVKLQSRLEEEEQAKAALMGRIQRLTRLILVSTKNMMSSNISERPGHRRRHSFGEDERPDHISGLSAIADSESSASGSPSCSNSSQQKLLFTDLKDGHRKSVRRVMIL
ncbi:hypothetical protein Taro_039376 [Colocasia esculenta]|uniref:Kinesin motor domain-containing protein n=1 Tax=Colocasia esculenta TaxID=4460 RepID=A0A843W971_COLES|nr:hypothetical protein [Colocasia esculenta]